MNNKEELALFLRLGLHPFNPKIETPLIMEMLKAYEKDHEGQTSAADTPKRKLLADKEDLIVRLKIIRNNLQSWAPTDCKYIKQFNQIIDELEETP